MYDHLAKKPPSKEYFERGKVPHIRAVGDFAYDDMIEHEKSLQPFTPLRGLVAPLIPDTLYDRSLF